MRAVTEDWWCIFKVLFHFFVLRRLRNAQQAKAIWPTPGDKIQRLEEIIRGHRISVEFLDSLLGDANGMSAGGKISIKSSLPKPHMFSTMVHELAHELLHWGDRRESTTKVIRETEAESVAFVVCRAAGLECSTRASDYIQLWNGDAQILLQSSELIRSVASTIISQLDASNIEAEATAEVA